MVYHAVDNCKFLGTTICHSLKWEVNTSNVLSKAHHRLHFLRQLKRFGVTGEAMDHFYRATMESVLVFSATVWYGNYNRLGEETAGKGGTHCI